MKRYGSAFVGALLSTTALTWLPAHAQSTAAAAPANQPMEEIIVRGEHIPEPKREVSEIASFITPEDLQKQGDSNAAESLRRVTGLSLVGGKFIYIRGLGERYSNANLNGLPLPSPEPLRRVVPLDLFPTGVLAGASAQKTYSPQYSGEFGGGVIEIQTKAVPDARFFDIGVEVGGNTETTWRDGLLYEGGNYDWSGFDDGIRKIPGPLQAAIDSGKRLNQLNYTPAQLTEIGRSLVNSELWVIFKGTTPGDIKLDASYGDRFLHGDTSYGILVSAGYKNAWKTKRGQQQTGRFGSDTAGNRLLVVADDFNFVSTENEVSWHGLLGAGLDWGSNEIKLTSLYIRASHKEARSTEGIAAQTNRAQRQDFTEWFERQMWTNQLAGTHKVDDDKLTIAWKGSYSIAKRDAPYQRFAQYRDFGDGRGLIYDSQQGRNLTRFSNVDDKLYAGALDLVYHTDLFGDHAADLKAGYLYTSSRRDSGQRDYRLLPTGGPLPSGILSERIDYIFSDQNINQNRFVLTEITGSTAQPAYRGELDIHGLYAGFDAEVVDYVHAALGGRWEQGDQLVDTFDFYTPNTAVETTIKKSYFLPAGTLTWNFADDMQLRMGASKTIGRPQFRELAPSDFIDPDTDRTFVGNPN
ncbi:MAG: TonB-dependent receptor domain-containing protein, partial [Rhodospirillaceae bacterium]